MAKFTAGVPLNFQYGGYRIRGASGATYRIDDGMSDSFQAEFADRIPGFEWINQDESSSYGSGEGGGVHPDLASHEALGLADASHNHDANYSGLVHTHAESSVTSLVTDLAGKAASVHSHAESSVTNLVTDLAGKAATVHSHAESSVTNLVSDLAAKAATVHTHAESDTTSLVTDLAGKAATVHSHAESSVTNLVSDLAGKAASVHTHAESSITNLVSDLAGKAASSHSHVEGDLPSTLATDSEVTSAVSAGISSHEATATHGSGGGGCPFRVGDILTSRSSVDPETSWPGTTWNPYGAGRIVVSINTADGSFAAIDQTGGAKTHAHNDHTAPLNHTHPVNITDPGHTHVQGVNSASTGGTSGYTADTSTNNRVNSGYSTSSGTTGITAGTDNPSNGVAALTHNVLSHMPPYIVAYMWERTA